MEQETKPQEDKKALLQKKYLSLCTKAGDLQYKIKCFEHELNQANEEMAQINKEYLDGENVQS